MNRRSPKARKPSTPCRWPTETQRIEAHLLASLVGRTIQTHILPEATDRTSWCVPNAMLGKPQGFPGRRPVFVDLLIVHRQRAARCPTCKLRIASTEFAGIGVYNVVLPDRKLTEREVRAELATIRTIAKRAKIEHYGIIYQGVQVPRWLANRLNQAGKLRAVQV